MKIGLQLYSVREALSQNVPETLRLVKEMGYDYVELAGGRYGLTGKEMRSALKKAGLTCVSIHSSPTLYRSNRDDVLSYLTEIGAQYSVIPCPPEQKKSYTENWDETFSLYEEMGRFFSDAGKNLLYHNHDYDFSKLEQGVIIHQLLERLKDVLMSEADLAWVSYAGVAPADFLALYSGRVPIVHMKDYVCNNLPAKPIWQQVQEGLPRPEKKSLAGFDYAPLGQGVEIWENVIPACEKAGVEYIIVEQDASPEPMKAAAQSRAYLRERFGL